MLEHWSCQYEYQRQVKLVITHTTARVGKDSFRGRLDSHATPRGNESNKANVRLQSLALVQIRIGMAKLTGGLRQARWKE
jgi:hypothetical protein